MSSGVPILGTVTKPCEVEKVSKCVFRITLVQGLNRQIRRMCDFFEFEVTKLERVRIMNISLKGLPVGQWRDLDAKELDSLFGMIRNSSSEATPGQPSETRKPAGKLKKKPVGKPGSGPGSKPGGGKPRKPGKAGKPGKSGKPRQRSVKR
jgi:23S rRNA pseudouridine2604 synthase